MFLVTFVVMLVVSMTLFSPIQGNIKLIIRIILLVIFFALWRWFDKKAIQDLKDLAFAFMALKKYPSENDTEAVSKDSEQALIYIKEMEEKLKNQH